MLLPTASRPRALFETLTFHLTALTASLLDQLLHTFRSERAKAAMRPSS